MSRTQTSTFHLPLGLASFGCTGLGIASLSLGALALAGCGKLGPLEQPAPLFGERAKAEYYAQKTEQQETTAQRQADERNAQGSAERQTSDQVASPARNTATKDTADPASDDAPMTTRDVQDPDQKLTTPRDSPVPGAPNSMGPMVSVRPPN